MFADYFLQTQRMLQGRATYLHVGRAQHATIHAVGSALAFVIVGTTPGLIAVIVLAEWVVHFHIDWGKARYSSDRELTPDQPIYWRAAGVDQALHQFTYIAMVGYWMLRAAA